MMFVEDLVKCMNSTDSEDSFQDDFEQKVSPIIKLLLVYYICSGHKRCFNNVHNVGYVS